jgi:DNA-binding NarL/FixJ family response regulator
MYVAFVTNDHSYDVMVVDDDPIVRAWLGAALRESEFRIAGEFGTERDGLAALERRHVDLVLVDFHLGESLGTDFVRELRRRGIATPALVMTAIAERGLNERTREAGAQGTLLKTGEHAQIVARLRTVVEGGVSFDPSHPRRPDDERPLSVREREVLVLLARGLTNREIGSELGIGEESVKTNVERLFAKLGAQRRAEAVDMAHRLGLLGR